MQYHAFLSYSHLDKDIMRRIRSDLTSAGLTVWTDESLVPGTPSWKNAIENAIQSSKTLVVILSPDAKTSDWIEKEMDYARACNVQIVPVLARGADDISAVPFELINVQRIDLRQDYRMGIKQLIQTIGDDAVATTDGTTPNQTPHIVNTTLEELNHISFYDHVRLFVWIFWQPQKLVQYRRMHGEESLRKTAAWLVSDLTWITFIAPAVGMVLGTVVVPNDNQLASTVMQGLSGVIFLGGWFATGWFGWRKEPRYAMLLLVGTTIIMFSLFTAVQSFSGVVLSQAGGLTRPFFLIVTGIFLSAGVGIAFRMTTTASAAGAGIILGSLLFNSLNSIQLHLDGGIMALVMFVTTILVAWVVDNSLKTDDRSIFHVGAFGLIIGAGATLIVLYFLGGWLILMNINVLSAR